ncbi:MAG TPA: hypothetical protein VMT85_14400 [Thermoanaerobaculia bacterium]|nr:hypothetical protein [Thermoanaerobaculia bacterium]
MIRLRRPCGSSRLVVLAVTSLSVIAAWPSAAQEPRPGPPTCDSTEHRQFDFWIGDWRVETPDGKLAGTNRIESILDGCVLMENWAGQGGTNGKSFNMYNRRNGKWQQTWIDNSGGRLDLMGGLEDGKMVLGGKTPSRDGGELVHRITWQQLSDGSVQQHWRTSRDGGESWEDAFIGIYKKQ